MKNQMFIPNSLQLKMLEKEKSKHQKKLEEIHTEDRKVKVIQKELSVSVKLSQTRQHNLKLSQKGKAVGLEQENELLLGKLVEISRKKSPNFVIRSESAGGKSLNAPYKKKEMMRISSENEAFAKRLISQQPTFNRKKLDDDFKKHKALVGHMKRINSSPGKNLGKKLLPSLKSDLTSPKSVVLRQSELKTSVVKENKEAQKEQPQQESVIVQSNMSENKNVAPPEVSEKKEEVESKKNENAQVAEVKENNPVSGLEASTLQKSQEIVEKTNPGSQSQRTEGQTQVKEANNNNQTGEKENK